MILFQKKFEYIRRNDQKIIEEQKLQETFNISKVEMKVVVNDKINKKCTDFNKNTNDFIDFCKQKAIL